MWIVAKILYREGHFIIILLAFIIISPLYYFNYLTPSLVSIYLLSNVLLRNQAPTKAYNIIYRLIGISSKTIFYFNFITLFLINVLNITILSIFYTESLFNLELWEFLNQIFLSNSIWLFGVSMSNFLLIYFTRHLRLKLELLFSFIYYIAGTIIFFTIWLFFYETVSIVCMFSFFSLLYIYSIYHVNNYSQKPF